MKNKLIFVIPALLLAVIVAVVAVMLRPGGEVKAKPRPKLKPKLVSAPKPLTLTCPLDGMPGAPDLVNRRPLAVMVENLVNVRPQAGLADACMVVEALTEGGITRLMPVYGLHDAPNIGPVRSARAHFVALARGLDALYGHVGGSRPAMQAIQSWDLKDIDEFNYPGGYRRVSTARTPHNAFTDTSSLRALAPSRLAGFSRYRGFAFGAGPPLTGRPASQHVTVNFSYADYRVDYQYRRETNSYLRSNGGRPHTDANTGRQLEPKNVVILYAPTSPIPGTPLLDINLIGSDRATVIHDGASVEGTWAKASVDAPLVLNGPSGAEIKLTPGQVLVEVVAPNTQVTIGL